MPYYPRIHTLFIHIPKTGGSVLEQELCNESEQLMYTGRTNDLLPYPFNEKSLQHQLYTTIYKYQDFCGINFDGLKMIAIVRNPYTRIISDLFFYGMIDQSTDAGQVYNIIKNRYLRRNDLDNHNIPQYKFVTDGVGELVGGIRIFKTENLNENNSAIKDYLGCDDINVVRENVNKNYDRFLNKKSIQLINDFYRRDFELFDYEMRNTD